MIRATSKGPDRLQRLLDKVSSNLDDPKTLVKLAIKLMDQGYLSEAWKCLEQVPTDNMAAQRLRVDVRYHQAMIDAARQEAVKYAQLFEPLLGQVSLAELLDETLRQAQVDAEEPSLSRWLWPRLNLPVSSREAWLVKLRWGLIVNHLIRNWIFAHRARLDELDDIVQLPDWSLLDAVKAEGKPAVIAGAHLGPAFLSIRFLDKLAHPLVMVGGNLTYYLTLGSQAFISAAETHKIVQLRDTLADRGTVYIAGDGRAGRRRCPVTLFNSPLHLPESTAALARMSRAPTFWYTSRWVGRQIKLELVPGPVPLQDESRDTWNARWFSFYTAQYERCVLAGPENLRSNTLGFWIRNDRLAG